MTDVDLSEFPISLAARIFTWCIEHEFQGAIESLRNWDQKDMCELYRFTITDKEATMLMVVWGGHRE